MKTKTVLGYKLTLVAGNRYVATRPMLEGDIDDDMPYDKANDFLNAFNCGKTSWDGRVW